jgi:hypothetical protein
VSVAPAGAAPAGAVSQKFVSTESDEAPGGQGARSAHIR